ncbi:hypothetical protein ACX1HF_19970 [Yersinia pseudotuberculosis]|nr:hypothetical protein [Yersinia pseudotuberculosis]
MMIVVMMIVVMMIVVMMIVVMMIAVMGGYRGCHSKGGLWPSLENASPPNSKGKTPKI